MGAFTYILSIALGQGILLAFFLLTSKYYKNLANTWLALSLLLLSTNSILDIVGRDYVPSSMLVGFFLHDIEFGLLIYVPLFFFFSISTSSSQENKYFNSYLFLPFIIDTLINIAIVSNFSNEAIATHAGVQLFYEIETYLSIAFNLFLCYKSYLLIKAQKNNPNKKHWIHRIWNSTAILLIVLLIITVSGYVSSSTYAMLFLIFYMLISIWMFWMLYHGIVNLKLIDDREDISLKLENRVIQSESILLTEPAPVLKEANSKQHNHTQSDSNPNVWDKHFHKINELLVAEALYRNEELSIEDIAQRIDMSAGYVSKIIKKTANKNFPSWINEFRVEEVKSMFGDDDFSHYTTLSIGLEAGFKSKSAFYATFKKMTGETPARFRKKKS